jgi:glycine betaine/proline transport system substrate-binding protein
MIKKIFKNTVLGAIALIMSTTSVLAADMVIGVPNWPTANATANILKLAIEQNLGLDVELQSGTNPIFFEGMDQGSVHVHPEVWMPNQQNLHDTFVTEKGSVAMNSNKVQGFTSVCVPTGFAEENGISSIEDLTNPDIAALFDSNGDGRGEIWIGAAGWASTTIERIRAKSIGYDQVLDLEEMDETIAYAKLANAIKAGEPWVGQCYGPHYIFALHDLTTLKETPHDPERWNIIQPTDDPNWLENSNADVAWPASTLHVFYAKSLESDFPQAAAMLANMSLDADALSLMAFEVAVNKKNVEVFAAEWIEANEDRVLSWFAD